MYNPYDLLELLVNNQQMYGRPVEFDSEMVNQDTMRNAFGSLVKPSKVSTVCPDCGQGLEVSVRLGEPPFGIVAIKCEHCYPAPPPPIDPFMNPVKDGRIPIENLDPMLHKYNEPFIQESLEPVTERVSFEDIPEAPKPVIVDCKSEVKEASKKKKEKAKRQKLSSTDKLLKRFPDAIRSELADGITEEVDEDRLV